jgi:hypothetical protein
MVYKASFFVGSGLFSSPSKTLCIFSSPSPSFFPLWWQWNHALCSSIHLKLAPVASVVHQGPYPSPPLGPTRFFLLPAASTVFAAGCFLYLPPGASSVRHRVSLLSSWDSTWFDRAASTRTTGLHMLLLLPSRDSTKLDQGVAPVVAWRVRSARSRFVSSARCS